MSMQNSIHVILTNLFSRLHLYCTRGEEPILSASRTIRAHVSFEMPCELLRTSAIYTNYPGQVKLVLCRALLLSATLILCSLSLHAKTDQQKKQECPALSTYYHPILNNFPNEISFCIADLKYDGTSIKICEFGEGLESRFKGYEALDKGHSAWSMLWNFLSSFNLPVWFVGKGSYDYDVKSFQDIGGTITSNLHSIKSDNGFMQALKNHTKHHRKEGRSAGIIVARSLQLHHSVFTNFYARYPQMILLGQATNKFVRSKYHTNKLFEGSELCQFRPKFMICEKAYSTTLANSIIKELGCNVFVIKPIDSALGNGVLIVEESDLNNTLRILFKDTNELEAFRKDMSYYHWKNDLKQFFIVEEYVPSKTLYCSDEPYDPTMRVMFALCNWQGTIGITYFDAYWKLAQKSLAQEGTLTEKHKSHIGSKSIASVPVDDNDFEMVKALLNRALPDFYLKMLQSSFPLE